MKTLKTIPLSEMLDKHFGKTGTKSRNAFETRIRMELDRWAKKEKE